MDPLGQVYQGLGGTGAAVIIGTPGINPAELHLARVQQYHEGKAADAQAREDAFIGAYDAISKFKGDGWYKHDQYLKGMTSGLYDFLTDSYVNKRNPFDAGDPDYVSFQNQMKDLEAAHNYSSQIKGYVDEVNTKLQGATPGEFTTDSIGYFNEFLGAPFEQQMQMGLPQLVTTPEVTDWMGNFTGSELGRPSTKFTKVTEGQTGYASKRANDDANLLQATQYLQTSPDRQMILDYFKGDEQAAINYLHTNLNERASVEYMEFGPEQMVYGTGAGTPDNPLGLGQNVYTIPGVFGGEFGGMYDVTGANEYAVNAKGYLTINTPEYMSVDEANWHKGEAANINFRPEGVLTYNVAANDVTITRPGGWGSVTINSGDIIPDELISNFQKGNGIVQTREFVRGLERYVEESTIDEPVEFDPMFHQTTKPELTTYYDLDNPPTISVTKFFDKDRTVYVPLDYINDDLMQTVDGYSDFVLEKNNYNQYAPQSGVFTPSTVQPAGSSGINWGND